MKKLEKIGVYKQSNKCYTQRKGDYPKHWFLKSATFWRDKMITSASNQEPKFSDDATRRGYIPSYSYLVTSINTCFKMNVEEGYDFIGESHKYWELVYVTKGTVGIKEDSKVYKLSEGEIIFHMPMEFHKIWCISPSATFLIISFLSSDDNVLSPLGNGVLTLDMEELDNLNLVYEDTAVCFDTNIGVHRHTIEKQDIIEERLLFLKFEHFLLSMINSKINRKTKQYTAVANNYKVIINVLTENIQKNLNVSEIADLCNMSVSNLKKTFSQYHTGGIMQYFTTMKIRRAISLLRHGFSVDNVSHTMGFSSQSYFSVLFKKETGVSPSYFKNKGFPNETK
ncbi:MAG: AraC family transcriptional regulator [Clostridia bacterium]|nr:AraC family transcriptional regulator [Clostridia bacterium]